MYLSLKKISICTLLIIDCDNNAYGILVDWSGILFILSHYMITHDNILVIFSDAEHHGPFIHTRR